MKTKQFIKDNKKRFLKELFELLKIQSVSVDPVYNKEVDKAADFLVKQFNLLKLDSVEKIKTEGHPIVYAEKILDKDFPLQEYFNNFFIDLKSFLSLDLLVSRILYDRDLNNIFDSR